MIDGVASRQRRDSLSIGGRIEAREWRSMIDA
jgi:hypothetical protein